MKRKYTVVLLYPPMYGDYPGLSYSAFVRADNTTEAEKLARTEARKRNGNRMRDCDFLHVVTYFGHTGIAAISG